jgi:hypothetical protein
LRRRSCRYPCSPGSSGNSRRGWRGRWCERRAESPRAR